MERLLMPQRRIRCPSHLGAASLLSDQKYTCQHICARCAGPSPAGRAKYRGREHGKKNIESMEILLCWTYRRWELGTATMVSEIKGTGRTAQQWCGELEDVMEES